MALLIAGVDEVGRGCLAGPVFAAAAIFPDHFIWPFEVKDSKALMPKKRETLALLIKAHTTAWAIGRAEVEEIESLNILHATMLAMQRAVLGLSIPPDHIEVDGNRAPTWHFSTRTIIKGDQLVPSIMAASILAKVARDEEMRNLSVQYPRYHFDKNKGYGTEEHLRLLQEWGPCPLHRRSFEPVRRLLSKKLRSISIIP